MVNRAAFGLFLVLMFVTGCGPSGPKMYRVVGQVTFDGKPIPEGEILLSPLEKGVGQDAGPIVNGRFDFMAKAGPKRVEIRGLRQIGTSEMGRVMEPYLPQRFNDASTLEREVQPIDVNEFDFELTSSKR